MTDMRETHTCQQEGCTNEAFPCFLPEGDEPNGYYCTEHAHLQGFCYICGQFWGGIESFDFGPGYCDNCRSEVEEDDDYDSDFDDPLFPEGRDEDY